MNFSQTGTSTHTEADSEGKGQQLSDDRAVSPTAEVRRILISQAFQPDRPSSDVYCLPSELSGQVQRQLFLVLSWPLFIAGGSSKAPQVCVLCRLPLAKVQLYQPFWRENVMRQYPFAHVL